MADQLVETAEAPPEPGMVRCKAPGCGRWFRKQSGRHIYCKQEGCTYRRGSTEVELQPPTGAAEEVLRRLQDPEGGGEVSQELIGARMRAISDAQRADDRFAAYGAICDAAVALIRWADRVQDGTAPLRSRPGLAAPARATGSPVGLAQAALSSHARTVTLAERRMAALWELIAAREAQAQAQAGVEATLGTEQSLEADELARAAAGRSADAERALQAVEAAWRERLHVLRELQQAGGGSPSNGGARRGSGSG